MDERSSNGERRRALRVPVRGEAVLHAHDEAYLADLENVSQRGVLLRLPRQPHLEPGTDLEVELRMLGGGGWLRGRAARIERTTDRWLVAVDVVALDDALRSHIDRAIAAARSTVERRPVLVIDSQPERRARLTGKLVARGLTPLTPRTPLEAMDLLTHSQMRVDVCIVGDGFDFDGDTISEVITDSFPWVTTEAIDDDLEDTALRAVDAWNASAVARMATVG